MFRKGMTGPQVVRIQQALMQLGISVGSTGADGVFGPATEAAVTQFQRGHLAYTPSTGYGVLDATQVAALEQAASRSGNPVPLPTTYTAGGGSSMKTAGGGSSVILTGGQPQSAPTIFGVPRNVVLYSGVGMLGLAFLFALSQSDKS